MKNDITNLIEINNASLSEKALIEKIDAKIERLKLLESIKNDTKLLRQKQTISNITITSKIKCFGPLIVFIKRVWLKLNKWVLKIYLDQQNDFNKTTVDTIDKIAKYLGDLK